MSTLIITLRKNLYARPPLPAAKTVRQFNSAPVRVSPCTLLLVYDLMLAFNTFSLSPVASAALVATIQKRPIVYEREGRNLENWSALQIRSVASPPPFTVHLTVSLGQRENKIVLNRQKVLSWRRKLNVIQVWLLAS